MKLLAAYVFPALFSFPCAAQNTSNTKPYTKKISVAGTVTQTYSYCGGARPTDEMLEELAAPRPYHGKKFYVIKGEKNSDARKIVLSFISDSLGKFFFRLPAGKYSVLVEEQMSPLNPGHYKTEFILADEACLKEWWEKPFYLLEIKKTSVKGLAFEFHHRCFIPKDIPCLQYDGPLPP